MTVLITGDTFDPAAANNEVAFIPAGGSPHPGTVLSVMTLDSTRNLRRLITRVPAGLPVGPAAIRATNRSTGQVSQGLSIDIVELYLPATSSAQVGAAGVDVLIEGSSNSKFSPNSRVVFGAGITVTSVTVHSATRLTARLSVSSTAGLGPRTPAITGSLQTAILANGFTVTPAAPPNAPPAIAMAASFSGEAGASIAFNPTLNDTDGDPLTQQWNYGDGSSGAQPAHTYSDPGTYTVTLTVTDGNGGSATAQATVTVTAPNQAPTAVANVPAAGTAGQAIPFDGSGSSDPNQDDTLTYEWQFGDGGTSDQAVVSHTYANPGTYSGSLTVLDGRGGTHTQTFQIVIAPPLLGRGVITGRVVDDLTSQPLADAMAVLLDANGEPLSAIGSTSDAQGRYRISTAAGPARIRVSKPGYTPADVHAVVVDSRRVDADAARLTRLAEQPVTLSSVTGGVVRQGTSSFTVPAGASAEDRIVHLTNVSPQGLVRRLPLGWAPLAAVDLAAGSGVFGDATLSVRPVAMAPAEREIVAARFDAVTGAWIALGAASRSQDNQEISATITSSGQHVFAIGDLPPTAPPAWTAGAALTGVAARPPPAIQLTLTPAPRILFARAGARSMVEATAVPSEPLPSGTPLTIDLAESFTFASGASLHPVPSSHRFTLFNVADAQPNAMRVSFGVSPSRTLAPFSLRQGAIDLAGRIPQDPGAPRGTVVGGSGGTFTASTGERIVVPSGASTEDLPVDLLGIPSDDFPLALPAGATLLRAFTIDLHGAPFTGELQLSIPATPGLPAGSTAVLVHLTDLPDETRMILAGAAQVAGDVFVVSSDPFGNGSVRLPGLRTEGRYALLALPGDLGYVTGIVTDAAGAAMNGAMVEAGDSPIAALTDADGRFVLLVPEGSQAIRATNLSNRDSATVTTQVAGGFGVTNQGVSLGASPPAILAITPANGAVAVPLGASVTVRFSEPIDPTSVTTDAVRLLAGAVAVPTTLSVDPGAVVVTLTPAALLQSHTQFSVSVAPSIRDTAGHQLGAAHVSSFTTVDVTPPAVPPPGTITASIPGTEGTSTISGSPGTADAGGVVVIRNLRTNALTTLTPDVDGSFTGIVAALRSDRLEMTIRDAAGNEITVPVPRFSNPDGSVVVGAEGGRVEGAGGVAADIPEGALPDGTIVRVSPIAVNELPAAVPDSYAFAGGVRLDLGGVAPFREIDLSIPSAPGANPGDEVVVVRPVQVGESVRWTVADRAPLVDGRHVTASPPFPGIGGEGNYSFLRYTGGCLSYVAVNVRFGFDLLGIVAGVPFVYPVIDLNTIVVPAPCGSTLNVQVTQPDTGALIEQITTFAPAAPGVIETSTELLTDDSTPPVVLQVNNPTGQQTRRIELTFSEPMDAPSVCQAVQITDSEGRHVPGHVFGCPAAPGSATSQAVFFPDVPFKYGEQYTIALDGATDLARNPIASEPFVFTPFEPRSLTLLQDDHDLRQSLNKCAGTSCSTSGLDQALIESTLFIANGVRSADEQYAVNPPRRLLAVDVSDPLIPKLIGWHETTTNPRALAGVDNANVAGFHGDLLLVAGGGRVAGGELAGKLEIFDVTACTVRPRPETTTNCLDNALNPLKGAKFLSTPAGGIPRPGVPFDPGVPQQIAVLHERRLAPAADTLVAYIGVAGIGIEAVDINQAFNAPFDASTNFAPNAVESGNYTDVGVLRNRVFAVGPDLSSGSPGVRVFDAELQEVTLPAPLLASGLPAFPGAARLGVAQNVVFDVDGDGNLGLGEDQDNDTTTALQEIFDLVVVSSGPLTTGCLGAAPCGELYVLDVSALTGLRAGTPEVLATIPLPGPAFSVQLDGPNKIAYVEIRGRGLGVVDLSHVEKILQGVAVPAGAWDVDHDLQDDRLLRVIARTDIFTTDLEIDLDRGIAYVNGIGAGPQIVQVSVNCSDLSLDFQPKPAATLPTFDQEKGILVGILNAAADRLLTVGGFADVAMLEQGSGSCFWRNNFPDGCTSFIPGTSDHDIEVFVPQAFVQEAQDILDAFVESKPSGIDKLGALTLFAVAREPFENAELLNGTPMNRSGDPAGDLAMGRQLLTLLWLLEGEYVTGRRGTMPTLETVLERLQAKHLSQDPVFPGEPSGIPRLEGYEWSLLQEFNFYKSGAMIRIRNACGGDVDAWADISSRDALDRSGNFDEDELRAGCQEELHLVAKAAIRSVLARLAASDAANPSILDIDRARYRSDACLTGVGDPRRPPADVTGYTEKACGSFEEYIVNVAVRSVRDGHGVFTAADLPKIFTFYCAKVGENCANREGQRIVGPLFGTDRDANQFVADALRFIELVQGQTFEAYITTLDNDTDPIGDIPFLSGIIELCAAHGVTITAGAPRADLRRCNRAIVLRKTNGDPTSGDPAKRGGVRNYVTKNLRVRALNLASRTVDVPVAMYEGTGTNRADYTEIRRVVLSRFGGGEIRFLEDEPDPDRPGKRRPTFRATFDLTQLAPNTPRAISFFIDPDGTVPENDRHDNAAAFFYYVLNLDQPEGPTVSGDPEFPTDAIEHDPLCRDGPKLQFEIRAYGPGNTDLRGSRDLSLEVGQTIEVLYRINNPGNAPMRDVTITRDGQVIGTIPEVLPRNPIDHTLRESYTVASGVTILRATATGLDEAGNSLPPVVDAIRLSGNTPPCAADIQSIEPDPNPFNEHGLPVSTVMRGGKLIRYYRLVRNDGGSVVDQRVTIRVRRSNGTQNLYVTDTDGNGWLEHVNLGDDDDPRGLMLETAQIGAPGESATVTIESVEGAATTCPQTFTAVVTERNYTRALKAGSSLEISGALVGLNIKAKPGVGFEYSLSGDTGAGDLSAAVSRLMSTTASVGLKGTAAKARVQLGGVASVAKAEIAGALRATMMLRDRHNFQLTNGQLTSDQELAVANLVAGLLVNSSLANSLTATGPAGPLLALIVNELHEHVAGLAQYRTSAGGSLGFGGRVNGELGGPTLSFRESGVPFLRDLGLTIGAEGSADVSAFIHLDLGSDLNVGGEYRQAFDLKAKLGLALVQVDAQTHTVVGKGVKAIQNMLDASGEAAGSIKINFVAGLNPLSLKRIVISISHKKKYGFALVGLDLVDEGSDDMRTLKFTISDSRKFERVLQNIAILQAMDLALNGIPAQVALSPTALANQIVDLLGEFDSFEETIERGNSYTIPIGLEGFLGGTGLGGKLELKLDSMMTTTLRKGAVTARDMFTLERYEAHDDAFPSPLGQELIDGIQAAIRAVQSLFQARERFVRVAALIDSLRTIAFQFSPSGINLQVDGAAEPQPLPLDVIGFKYEPVEEGTFTPIREPEDVTGPADGPHYGVGGFFNLAPTDHVLAAPAQLTIHWDAPEIQGFDPASLAIYRWNDTRLDWDFVGGAVDLQGEFVRVNVDRLGMYTAAPPMPSGTFAVDATYASSGTEAEPTTDVTITTGAVTLNTGAAAPDGTMFTVRALVPNASDPIAVGEILTADADPTREGVQVATVGGRVQYTVRMPGRVGDVLAVIHALHGTALGESVVVYERPQ